MAPNTRFLTVPGPLACYDRPIFRPIELERLARQNPQRPDHAAAACLLFLLPSGLPVASEGRHAIVGAVIAEGGQISVQLLGRPLLLARLPGLLPQHMRQLVGVGVQLARAIRDVELRFNGVRAQVLADCVPRQTCASGYLSDREMISIMPASDDAQQLHVDHSVVPCPGQGAKVRTWVSSRWKNPSRPGHLSVEINSPAKNLSCLDIAPTTSPAVSPLVIGKHEHA